MSEAMTPVRSDHPMMVAWKKWQQTDEFKNALEWSVRTAYDDGRAIDDLQREQHVKGGLWLAFTKGMVAEAEGMTLADVADEPPAEERT